MTIDLDFTHDPQARSWIEGPASHADFPVQNLPLGVFAPPDDPDRPRGGVAGASLSSASCRKWVSRCTTLGGRA